MAWEDRDYSKKPLGVRAMVAIGIPCDGNAKKPKEIYGRATVVQIGNELAREHGRKDLKSFTQLTALFPVGNKSTYLPTPINISYY